MRREEIEAAVVFSAITALSAGKRNFAVVVNEILSIDWLLLSSKGHQRASYDFNDRGVTKVWLAP